MKARKIFQEQTGASAIEVADLKQGADWYCSVFELAQFVPTADETDEPSNCLLLAYSREIPVFWLYRGDATPNSAPVNLDCSDAKSAFEFLLSKGVAATAPQEDRDGAKFVEMTDPYGNRLCFNQT